MDRKPQTYWQNPLMWVCTRHIPTHLTHLANQAHCTVCRTPRPEQTVMAPRIPVATPLPPLRPEVVTVVIPLPSKDPPSVDPPVGHLTAVVPGETPGCSWPRCRKKARENSPYCSKICSDKCGRVRRKEATTPPDKRLQDAVIHRRDKWLAWIWREPAQ